MPDASAHRLGFAVKVLGEGGLSSHDTRRWASGPHLRHSLSMVREIVAYLDRHDLRMYRMATALAPYASHPDLPQFHDQVRECAEELAGLGALIRATGIRVSTHPGQYTVLNSEDPAVQAAAAAELEVQASLLDAMGLGEEAVVVVHVGGAVGGREAAFGRFSRGLERLSDAARARLVIENDDRSFALVDVLALAQRTGLRVVWDILHHRCLDPAAIPDAEAMAAAFATWPAGTTPKIHFSSPRLDVVERVTREGRRVTRRSVLPQLRAHADLIDPIAFEYFIRSAAGREAIRRHARGQGEGPCPPPVARPARQPRPSLVTGTNPCPDDPSDRSPRASDYGSGVEVASPSLTSPAAGHRG